MIDFLFKWPIKRVVLCFSIMLQFVPSEILAQKDFNKFYKNSDPALDTLNLAVKLSMHKDFLNNSISKGDTIKSILGHLYLANDFFIQTDYPKVMSHLVEAEKLASLKNDALWLGRINHKKGAIYSVFRNEKESIKYYQLALSQHKIARDSQYTAITLEQLGSKFSNLKKYDKSNKYYELAIPMVEKYWNPKTMIVTLINYGNSLDEQGLRVTALVILSIECWI